MTIQEIKNKLLIMNVNIGNILRNSRIADEYNYELQQEEYCLSLYYGTYAIIDNKLKINNMEYELLEKMFVNNCTDWRGRFDYLQELKLLVDEEGLDWLFIEGNIL